MKKKLTRSRTHRAICGVLGGIAEYYDTDPVLVRLGYLALTLVTGLGPGIVLYIIAVMVIPEANVFTETKPVTPESDDASAV